VILEFGLKKPAFRIVVNSPTTHGSVGLSTGLDPAMTLGCGGYGGNITSDNISPRHLLNIKRLAYELTPTVSRWERAGSGRARGESRAGDAEDVSVRPYDLPSPPRRPPVSNGIQATALSRRIDQFLAARGYQTSANVGVGSEGPSTAVRPRSDRAPTDVRTDTDRRQTEVRLESDRSGRESDRSRTDVSQQSDFSQTPLDFVCEEDVRRAIQSGRTLTVSERAIVTPAARDLGEQHRIFRVTPWRD
jgi:hypothetical protein